MGNSFFARLLITISIAAAVAVGVIALSTFSTDAAEVTEVAALAEVGIINMKFDPERLEVKAGTTVKWVNKEKRTNHSVFFEKEGIPESDRLFPGETWERKFDTPGIYPYICGPHPHMKGEIIVVK